jgi:hypothetical protein
VQPGGDATRKHAPIFLIFRIIFLLIGKCSSLLMKIHMPIVVIMYHGVWSFLPLNAPLSMCTHTQHIPYTHIPHIHIHTHPTMHTNTTYTPHMDTDFSPHTHTPHTHTLPSHLSGHQFFQRPSEHSFSLEYPSPLPSVLDQCVLL